MLSSQMKRRGQALENGFFITREAVIISKIEDEKAEKTTLQKLQNYTGINDTDILKSAMGHGLSPSTLYAFIYYPIVCAAWSDGLADDKEKKKVRLIAKDLGISAHEGSVKQIEYWLNNQPSEKTFETWKLFFKEFSKGLSSTQRDKLNKQIIEKAKTVAQASGMFPFIGDISRAEKKFLHALEGFLTDTDDDLTNIRVSDFMTNKVVTCKSSHSVEEAATIMLGEGYSAIPVVNDQEELVGIITESDFVGKQAKVPHALASIKSLFGQHFYFNDIEPIYKKAKEKTLGEVMTKGPITITKEHTLTDVINLMNQRDLKRIPVVEGKKVVGIVTRKDLLKAFLIL